MNILRTVRRTGIAVVALLLGVAGVTYYLGVRDADTGASARAVKAGDEDQALRIERGRYLATAANCAGCHTVPGGQPYAGGTPLATAFGTFYGPNITPDEQQGIGQWGAEDFWRAMHHGKGRDGQLLYPAFPYTEYTRMTRDDVDALYAFLRTVPASDAPSRPHDLHAPYGWRPLLAWWRWRHFEAGPLPEVAGRDAAWTRGRYLVEGVAHCTACHTPRGRDGGLLASQAYAGGLMPDGDWYATALTADPVTGLGRWQADDIVALLRAGVSPHGTALGPMADVVVESTQHLRDEDLHAMATYLKTLPAGRASKPAQRSHELLLRAGAGLYRQHCVQCHGEQGEGKPPHWPALAGNLTVNAPLPHNLIRAILDGGYAPATAANPRPHGMPPYRQLLTDAEVANLATYVRSAWGNQATEVSGFEVTRTR